MATASPETLPSVTIGETFTVIVSIIPGPFESISSVSASLAGVPLEPGITVTSGSSSVTISGKHQNTFTDVFTYTEPGQVAPVNNITGRGNMPPNKNLFNLNQDQRKSETRTFNIIVNGGSSIAVTQVVTNPLETMRQFMADYKYKGA